MLSLSLTVSSGVGRTRPTRSEGEEASVSFVLDLFYQFVFRYTLTLDLRHQTNYELSFIYVSQYNLQSKAFLLVPKINYCIEKMNDVPKRAFCTLLDLKICTYYFVVHAHPYFPLLIIFNQRN